VKKPVADCRPKQEAPMPAPDKGAPIVIKCYARRRLYDSVRGRYVTVEILRDWHARAVAFTVIDADTGADVTRVLLA
jgi:polyhydroxyalkanoate synthesis regulator protein